jgi:hypothetical protein
MKLLSKLTCNLRPNYSPSISPSNLQQKRGGFRDNLIILLQQSIQERVSRQSITTSSPSSALNPFYSLPSHLPEQKIRLGETPRSGETEAVYPPPNRRPPRAARVSSDPSARVPFVLISSPTGIPVGLAVVGSGWIGGRCWVECGFSVVELAANLVSSSEPCVGCPRPRNLLQLRVSAVE